MSKKKIRKNSNRAVIVVTIVFFVIGFYAGGYFSGMKFQNYRFVKSSNVTFDNLKSGQKIYLNEKSLGTVKEDGQKISTQLKPGKHKFIVTKTAYWPWAKEIDLVAGQNTNFNPFLIAQIPDVKIYTFDNAKFESLKDKLSIEQLPKVNNPERSSDGTTELWLEGNSIKVKNLGTAKYQYFCNPDCADTLTVLESNTDIKALYFFPNRSDVVLFSTFEGIFAIELDGRSIRNFAPLYKGEFINFGVFENEIFILVTDEKIYNILL